MEGRTEEFFERIKRFVENREWQRAGCGVTTMCQTRSERQWSILRWPHKMPLTHDSQVSPLIPPVKPSKPPFPPFHRPQAMVWGDPPCLKHPSFERVPRPDSGSIPGLENLRHSSPPARSHLTWLHVESCGVGSNRAPDLNWVEAICTSR